MPEPFDIATLALPEDSEIPALLAAMPNVEVQRFGDEELLARAHEPARHFFLLMRGTCLVELPPPEPEQAEETLRRRPGSEIFTLTATPARPLFVGEMACFGDGLRSASVRSSMNSVAIRLDVDDLRRILEEFPRLTRTLCEQFSERLLELNEQLRRHRQQLMMQAEQVFIEAGYEFFQAGDAPGPLYQLVDGAVILTASDGTQETIRPATGKPVFIDPLPYFTGAPQPRSAKAKTSVIAVAIDPRSRDAVVRNFPQLTLDLLRQHSGA